MDYKEKYKQAIENIKRIKNANRDNKELVDFIEYQYPELKESEEELMRKETISIIRQYSIICEREGDKCYTADKVIAWLEKQGEQNLPDNVKSKFKVGDWVVQGKMLYQIEKVTNLPDNHFQYWTTDGVWFGDGTEAHLWTIQDAKDGDVLANENMVLIFKRFEEPSYRQHIIAHIGLDTCGYIQITNDSWNLGLNGANPATNEQRDLLFQKMKEAGYEWDAEKKELKKIEQKSAKCIQWTGNNLKEVINFTGKDKNFDKWFKSFEEYEKYVHEHNNIFKLFNEDGSHFEIPVGAWIIKTPDGCNVASKVIFKNKPIEWSKKDEEICENIFETIDSHYYMISDYKEMLSWLKSLKERVQPKQEWSEEDEEYLQNIVEWVYCFIDDEDCGDMTYDEHKEFYMKRINWLKSLKQRMKGE